MFSVPLSLVRPLLSIEQDNKENEKWCSRFFTRVRMSFPEMF